MPKVSDVYAGDYVKAVELPKDMRRVPAQIIGAEVEKIGQDQQDKLVLELQNPDGRKWPRKVVLNKTNSGILASAYGDDTDDWINKHIEVWSEPVQFGGKIVPGIKIMSAAAPPPSNGAGTETKQPVTTVKSDGMGAKQTSIDEDAIPF